LPTSQYEEAVKVFEPYDRVEEENPSRLRPTPSGSFAGLLSSSLVYRAHPHRPKFGHRGNRSRHEPKMLLRESWLVEHASRHRGFNLAAGRHAPMNRKLWTSSLSKWGCPEWPCPHCKKGKLKLIRESLHFKETATSLGWHCTKRLGILAAARRNVTVE